MSHRRGFWIAVALLVGAVIPLFLGEMRAGEGSWIGLVGAVVGLGVSSADQLVGRAYRERHHPWGDAALVLVLAASLAVLWTNFLYVDAWEGWWGKLVLGPIVAFALALPVLRWLAEPFPRIPFWTATAVATGLTSSTVLFAWKWNRSRYDPDPFGPEELLLASLAASPWVLGLPLVALIRLDRDPERVRPRKVAATALAGAFVGLAHALVWTLVRYDSVSRSYSYYGNGATDAFEACAWGSLALLYGLGPTAISRLLGSPESAREPAADAPERATEAAGPGAHPAAAGPGAPR